MERFTKQCPKCGRKQVYGSKKAFLRAVKEKWKCRQCAVSASHKQSPRCFFGTDDYKQKMSLSLKFSRKTDSYGEAFKQRCRENKLKQIQQQGIQRTYNTSACRFIDNLNVIMGWNLQHALNGGEIQIAGYSLDGYDKNRNIVFEYDEPKHNTTYSKIRDREREQRIIKVINPSEFWRYDEKNNKLMEIIHNKEAP